MESYQRLTKLLKALNHPTRLALLEILRNEEECVCHMTAALNLRQAYVSQQLTVLRQAGLVEDRRDGWRIYYRVIKPEVFAIVDAARSASGEPAQKMPARLDDCPCPKCQAARQLPQIAASACEAACGGGKST